MALLDDLAPEATPNPQLALLAALGNAPAPSPPPSMAPPLAAKKPNVKAAVKDFAGTLMFTLGEAFKASATAPGGRGTAAGMGAAFQAPMILQQLRQAEADKAEQQRLAGEELQRKIKQQDFQNWIAGQGAVNQAEQLKLSKAANARAALAAQQASTENQLDIKKKEFDLMNPPKPSQSQRTVVRNGKEYYQYYDQKDPGTTLVEVEKGPAGAAGNLRQTTVKGPGGRPILANFDPVSGETRDAAGALIANPEPFQEPRNEAGSYLPYTDKRGQVIYWVNAKTREKVSPEELGIKDDMYKGAISMDRQTREAAATSGLNAIKKFREEMKKNPQLLAQLSIPGSPGARIARAARAEMIDVLTRVRTGAALNNNEQEFYNGQAPNLLDSLFAEPDTVEYKLSIFENNFKALAPERATSGAGGEVEELEFGPDGKLRAKVKK